MPGDRGNLPKDALPISDFYTLLDSRTYVRTSGRIIALCALESKQGRRELKLYEWVLREGKGWRVNLAKINVQRLNLRRITADAEQLAATCNIPLNWD